MANLSCHMLDVSMLAAYEYGFLSDSVRVCACVGGIMRH